LPVLIEWATHARKPFLGAGCSAVTALPPITLPNEGRKLSRFTAYMLALTAMAFLVVVVLT